MCSGSHSCLARTSDSDETNITSRKKVTTLSSREHGECDGSESWDGRGLRGARGIGGRIRPEHDPPRRYLHRQRHDGECALTGAFVRIDSMYAPGGLIGAV